jgi:hypothetical protein
MPAGGGGTGAGPSAGRPDASLGPDAGPVFTDAAAGSLYDAPAGLDAAVGQTVTLTMDAFTVQPGQEVYMCQLYANPFGGKNADLIMMDGTMSQGSHHFFLFNVGAGVTPSAVQPCLLGGLEIHPFPYLSQQPHWVVTYPEPGMGYPLSGNSGVMMNAHFLNASSAPLQASVKITLYAAKPGLVTKYVGSLFLNNTSIFISPTPVSSPVHVSSTMAPSFSHDYSIITSWSHMHRWGLDFTASAGGTQFYEEKQWNEPPLYKHQPYLSVKSGTSITWDCKYYNDTGGTLTFGESQNNVMCIYVGQYFPADPNSPDYITNF